MNTIGLKPKDMEKRIARFKDLKPYKQSIMENTGIPAEAIEVVYRNYVGSFCIMLL